MPAGGAATPAPPSGSAQEEAVLRKLLHEEESPLRGGRTLRETTKRVQERPPERTFGTQQQQGPYPRPRPPARHPHQDESRRRRRLLQKQVANDGAAKPRGQSLSEMRRARLLQEHKERLRHMQPRLDNAVPKTARMKHVRSRLKSHQDTIGRRLRVEYENQILVQRMTAVMHRQNKYTDVEKKTLRGRHERQRLWEFKRIESENRKLAERLERVPPFQTRRQLKKDWAKTKKKMATMCAYPLVIAQPYRPESRAPSKRSRNGRQTGPSSPARILVGDVRIFPSRSKDLPVGYALSPKLGETEGEAESEEADTAALGPLGFVEKTGAKVDWEAPEPPRVGAASAAAARPVATRRHDVFSEIYSAPATEYSHGSYESNVTFVLVAVHMAVDEIYRTLEIRVSRLRSGVASQRREDQHALIVSYSDIFALVGGDTRDTYEAVLRRLWFRNNRLMLTSQLPSVVQDVFPAGSIEPAAVELSKEEENRIAKLQARVRGQQARAMQKAEHDAAVVLQTQFRKFSTRSSIASTEQDQPSDANEAGSRLEGRATTEDESAVKLQSAFRGYNAKRRQRKQADQSAVKLQSAFRGYHAKKQRKRETQGAVKLQGAFRGYHAKKQQQQQRKQEDESAAKLQGAFRGYHAKKQQQRMEDESAAKLQGAFRGYHAKKQRKEEDQSAVKLQSAFRGHKARRPLAEKTLRFQDGECFGVRMHHGGEQRVFVEIETQQESASVPVQRLCLELLRPEPNTAALCDEICSTVLRHREGNLSSIAKFGVHADPRRFVVHPHPRDSSPLALLKLTKKDVTFNRAQRTPLFIREYSVGGKAGVKIQQVFNAKDNSTRWYEFASS